MASIDANPRSAKNLVSRLDRGYRFDTEGIAKNCPQIGEDRGFGH